MKHQILVKFTEEVDQAKKDMIAQQALTLFGRLLEGPERIDGIHCIKVNRNCVQRPNRYDMQIELDMEKDSLEAYDASEPHKIWKRDFAQFIKSKAIFDCEG